jgi:hypothetical protein
VDLTHVYPASIHMSCVHHDLMQMNIDGSIDRSSGVTRGCVGWQTAHSPRSRYMYEVRTPEIERNIYIDTHVVAMVLTHNVTNIILIPSICVITMVCRCTVLCWWYWYGYHMIRTDNGLVRICYTAGHKKLGNNVQIHSIRMHLGRLLSNAYIDVWNWREPRYL